MKKISVRIAGATAEIQTKYLLNKSLLFYYTQTCIVWLKASLLYCQQELTSFIRLATHGICYHIHMCMVFMMIMECKDMEQGTEGINEERSL